MSSAGQKIVVDCSKAGAPSEEFAQLFREAALAAIEDANLDRAAKLMQEAKAIADAAAISPAQTMPLEDHERAALAAIQTEGVELARQERKAEIAAALAATDHWLLRAQEDGKPLPAAREKHRDKLRGLLAKVADANDRKALNAIKIPDPPK